MVCGLGLGVAGVHAATIQSPAPAEVPVATEPAQDGQNGGAATATVPTQDSGAQPFDWLNQPAASGFSNGGVPHGGKSKGSQKAGRSSGSSRRGGSKHSGSGGKGGRPGRGGKGGKR